MDESERLKELAKAIYDIESPYTFTELFKFLSRLPELKEKNVATKSDAEILDLLIDYERVFAKLLRKKTTQPVDSNVPKGDSSIKFLDEYETVATFQKDPNKEQPGLVKRQICTVKHRDKPQIPEKEFPRFFKAYYLFYVLSLVILTGVYCSGSVVLYPQNFTLATFYAVWAIIHIFIYFKCPQRAFTNTYIVLTVISFISSCFSLASAYSANDFVSDTSSYIYPVAIKVYFCIVLCRITYNKTKLEHPLLLFIVTCFSATLLMSCGALGLQEVLSRNGGFYVAPDPVTSTPLPYSSTPAPIIFSPPKNPYTVKDEENSLNESVADDVAPKYTIDDVEAALHADDPMPGLEVDIYGVPIVYWTTGDCVFHLDPDCSYRLEGGLKSGSANTALERDCNPCSHCISYQLEHKIYASISKKANLTQEQRQALELNQ